MDGGGRLAEPLRRARPSDRDGSAGEGARRHLRAGRRRRHRLHRFAEFTAGYTTAPMGRLLHRALHPLANFHLPRGAGMTASALLIGGSLAYGSVAGGHVAAITREPA